MVPLVIGTWPTDIVANTLVFIAKGTLIMSLRQTRTFPLVPDICGCITISSQRL